MTMPRNSFTWCRLLIGVMVVAGTLALASPSARSAPAGSPADAVVSRASYLGRWNYDQPDLDGTRNIAVLRCPPDSTGCTGPAPDGGPLAIPQVGDVVFTEGPDGSVIGRTDVGCTWHFAVRHRSLELAPAVQSCFNEVLGVEYTITRWSVTVQGNHQRETITALSHRPGSGDFEFLIEDGRRTRAPEPGSPGTFHLFGGVWDYTPADRGRLVNVVTTRTPGPDGVEVSFSEQSGTVRFDPNRDGRVVAQTADGCHWRLLVRGNTAHLSPERQTCQVADTTVTLTHWTIASDGRHQASRMRGHTDTDTSSNDFLLTVGDLHRRR